MMHNATNIGKLDIVWRSNLGERGRLQTSQLQRMVCFLNYNFICNLFCFSLILKLIFILQAPEYGDIRVTMKNIPLTVYLEQMMNFNCHIINTS